jgi:hypothetical protein
VNHLTKHEVTVLCIIILLLVTGMAVKTYRTAHPAMVTVNTTSKP